MDGGMGCLPESAKSADDESSDALDWERGCVTGELKDCGDSINGFGAKLRVLSAAMFVLVDSVESGDLGGRPRLGASASTASGRR